MNKKYALLLQKPGGVVINSFTRWGIVCCKVPFKAGGKVKDMEAIDLPDCDGEIMHFPSKLPFEAYDAEFEMAYQGQELAENLFNLSLASSQIEAFKAWLSGADTVSGSGTELSIYSPYSGIGRQKCYLKEISDEEPFLMSKQAGNNLYTENVVTFKVVFRVTDPATNIVLSEV